MRPAPALRYLALAAILAFAVAALAAAIPEPRQTRAATNCDADTSIDSEEQAFLGLINSHRAAAGAPALTITQPLTRAAAWFAGDMAAKNYFPLDHVDLLGRDPFTRMNQCEVPGWDNAGENIVAGQATAQAAFTTWRNSADHNANMLNANFRGIGIARAFRQGTTYGWYWTTTFSANADGSAPPSPPPAPQPPAPPPGCTSVSLASNQGATVAPGTAVALTASATCPASATYQWWGAYVAPNGNQSWQQITAYGAPGSYTWTAPSTPGNYILGAWVKVNGSAPAGGFDASTTVNVTVAAPAPAPCSGATLSPAAGTSKVGQTVRFTANATCAGTAQYQWWGAIVLADGSQTWQALTQFGAARTYEWTPTGPGTYLIGVWAKNQGTAPAGGFETSATNQFVITP